MVGFKIEEVAEEVLSPRFSVTDTFSLFVKQATQNRLVVTQVKRFADTVDLCLYGFHYNPTLEDYLAIAECLCLDPKDVTLFSSLTITIPYEAALAVDSRLADFKIRGRR